MKKYAFISSLLVTRCALAQAQHSVTGAKTFASDVAPIVYQNCTPCHHPGGAGPFPLTDYETVKKHARQIADVTRRHYMPPWLPEAGFGTFKDEHQLTDEQIQTIADWVRNGTPQGDVAQAPPSPRFNSEWQLGTPDLILKAMQPFAVPAAGPDVFWNFLFTPNLSGTRYIRAIEIRPGGENGARDVHHANILIDRTGAVLDAKAREHGGFPGMDVTIDRNPFDPDSHFLFWKPGSVPYSEPDGFSWRLDPGNLLVLNTHLQPSGKPERIAPEIGLYFTDQPPKQFPILVQLERDGALHIPAGARDFLVADDFETPSDADLLAIYPHAHYLGKRLEAYATLPGGERKWLIRIPDWDLNWQSVYRYREPVFLPKGTVISMRYQYDNSASNPRNPNNPPKRVDPGDRATDEMAHLWLQVLPRGRGDHRRTWQEAMARHRLQEYPDDFTARLNLGAILMSRLDAQGAVSTLREAIRVDPSHPEAHDMLGSALQSLGRSQEAIAEFEIAIEKAPAYMNARYNLANALARAGREQEAVMAFAPVAAAFSRIAVIQDRYGVLLELAGRHQQAIAQFDRAIKLDPSDEEARRNREAALSR